jgi:hypothetical protein
MRFRLLLFAPVCLVLFGANSRPSDLALIKRLDEIVQFRFRAPLPGTLGMSRVARPPSMGEHFQPVISNERDFFPENEMERDVIGKLEENGVHVGLFVFGAAVVTTPPQALNYRALKGPGAITKGTVRPAWYPAQPQVRMATADALPDWKAVYPLAKRAMQSFEDGGTGFETRLEGWNIAARPVAAEQRCSICHNNMVGAVKGSKSIGGVLYAFRRG